MPLPPMTPEQRGRLRAKAAEARSARSALLANVRPGTVKPGAGLRIAPTTPRRRPARAECCCAPGSWPV